VAQAFTTLFAHRFSVPPGHRSSLAIIGWWEARRLAYNRFAGALGIVCLGLCLVFVSASGRDAGDDATRPMALVAGPVMMNLAYTLGWLAELRYAKIRPDSDLQIAPRLMQLGIGLTGIVIVLPTVVSGATWLVHIVRLQA